MATSSQKLAASKPTWISWIEASAREVGGIPAIALGMVLPMAEPALDRLLTESSPEEMDRLLVRGAQWLLSHLSDGHPAALFIPVAIAEPAEESDDA